MGSLCSYPTCLPLPLFLSSSHPLFPIFQTHPPRQLTLPSSETRRLLSHWTSTYSWRAQESQLNKLPHFKTQIPVDGFGDLDIHFLHQESEVKGAVPLLFVHGWPGSWMEVVKILPLLKGGEGRPAFHVVAPSLPNYCFSGGVKKVSLSDE